MVSKSSAYLSAQNNLGRALAALLVMILPCMTYARDDRAADETVVEADKIIKGEQGEFTLNGNAVVSQGNKKIRAESINYQQEGGQVKVGGGLEYIDSEFKLTGSSGNFSLENETGVILDAEYGLVQEPGNGVAEKIRIKSRTNAVMDDSSYTTCPVGDNDWRIVASEIDLDTAEGVGTSVHTRLEFFDVPVMYFPYYRFPIDDKRKTGFLLPSGGYSSEDGLDLRIPFYWNLAPNYDATFTSRVLSKRGLAMESEFRYLLDKQAGQLNFDYLPDDDIYNDDRYLITFNQHGSVSDNITNHFQLAYASDKEYFSDLGNNTDIAGVDHLNSSIGYYYGEGDWRAGLYLQAYQILDDDIAKQYQRLPKFDLAYNGHHGENDNWLSQFNFEFTNFEHPENELNPTGFRSDIYYKLTYDMAEAGWFLRPSAAIRHSNYLLDSSSLGGGYNESRTIYTLALDGGLIFERDFSLFDRSMVQTFEPRLFLLYSPYRDQQNLPVFDSTVNSLSFAQLFAEDRFSGPDRVGDTTQVTAAISSNVIDNMSGRNILSLNLGEIFYLEDRLVTLGSDQLQTQANSNFIANLQFAPLRKLLVNTELEWNHSKHFTQLEQLSFEYRQDNQNRFAVSYLQQKDENALVSVDSAVMKFALQYDSRWRTVGKWNYSLLHEATQESFLGLEYDSGCWAARIISHRYIEEMNNPAQAKHQILFEIELLGVGGFGKEVDDFMNP